MLHQRGEAGGDAGCVVAAVVFVDKDLPAIFACGGHDKAFGGVAEVGEHDCACPPVGRADDGGLAFAGLVFAALVFV